MSDQNSNNNNNAAAASSTDAASTAAASNDAASTAAASTDAVVTEVSMPMEVSGLVDVQRRSGAEALTLAVEQALYLYMMFMGGVDRGDQRREMGGGFASEVHCKKWYKKARIIMLIDSFFAWNIVEDGDDSD